MAQWLQGHVIASSLVQTHLISAHPCPPDLDWQAVLCVIVSQSCDLANVRAEPLVDCLPFAHLPKVKGNEAQFQHGINPRRLIIEEAGSLYTTEQWHLLRLPKAAILAAEPQSQLCPDNLSTLCRWLGKRYPRAAFPDEFNQRLKAQDKALKALWKSPEAASASGVYLDCPDNEYIDIEAQYTLRIVVTYKVQSSPGSFSAAPEVQQAADSFASRLDELLSAISGIEIADCAARPESHFTLHDLRLYRRWDLDDRSLSREQSSPPSSVDAP